MAKRAKTTGNPKRPRDVNQLAHELVRLSTEPPEGETPSDSEISRVMAELGRRGGKVGGRRRAQNMTQEERSNAAALAARQRWKKTKRVKKPS
jgi:hypothetical protein